jgi:hypothetical protein
MTSATKHLYQSIIRITLKTIGWLLVSLLSLTIILVLTLQINAVQRFLSSKTELYLKETLKTPVKIGGINFSIIRFFSLKNVYIPDQQNDTILFSKNVYVGFSISKILKNEIEVNRLEFEGITSKIKVSEKDSSFNFDYIIKAFVGTDTAKSTEPEVLATSPKTESSSPGLNIKNLKLVSFKDIRLAYIDGPAGLATSLSLGNFSVDVDKFDFLKSIYHVKKISLANTFADIKISKISNSPETTDTSTASLPAMDFVLNQLLVENLNLHYVDETSKQEAKFTLGKLDVQPRKIDVARQRIFIWKILIDNTNVEFAQYLLKNQIVAQNNTPTDSTVATPSKKQNWKFKLDNFIIQNFSAKYDDYNYKVLLNEVDPNHLYIYNFNLNIADIEATPNKSLAWIKTMNFKGNHGLKMDNFGAKILIDSTMLAVQDLNFSAMGIQMASTVSAKYENMDKIVDGNFDVDFKKLTINLSEIKKLLPPNTIPSDYLLPPQIAITGKFNGGMSNFSLGTDIRTSIGNVKMGAKCSDIMNFKRAKYDINLDLDNFQLGRFLKMDTVTNLTISLEAEGKGLDMDVIDTRTKVDIKKLYFNNYAYSDFVFEGQLKKKSFDGSGFMVDENAEFDLKLMADLNGNLPVISLKTNIQKINLQALQLYEDSLSISGDIESKIKGASLDTIDAHLSIQNFKIQDKSGKYDFESKMDLTAKNKNTNFTFVSNIFDAGLSGSIQLTEAAGIFGQFIDRYFSVKELEGMTNYDYCNFKFNFNLKDISLIRGLFVPDLKELKMDEITGTFSNKNMALSLNGGIPKVIYGDFNINNVLLNLTSNPDELSYSVGLDSLFSADFCVPGISLTGDIKNNTFLTRTCILDRDHEKDIAIIGTLTPTDAGLQFSLADTGFIFDHQAWLVPSDNFIRFDSTGITAHNVVMQNESQKISFLTGLEKAIPTAILRFDSFDVHNFSAAMMGILPNENVVSVGGSLSGNIKLLDPTGDMRFATDLKISEFVFVFQTLGDISIKVSNLTSAEKFDIDFGMAGTNNLNIAGSYTTDNPQNPMDFDINIETFDVFPIGFWVADMITDLQGTLDGKLSLKGSPDFPKINGYMHCNEIGFNVTMLGAKLRLADEKINFDPAGIHFINFKLTDEFDNKATVKGSLLTENFTVFNLNLRVLADKIALMNSTEKDNKEYFGKLFLGTDTRIRGTSNHPIVDAQLNIAKETDLTYVLENNSSFQSSEGIVEFINTSKEDTLKIQADTTNIFAMDITSRIIVDKKAKFKAVLAAYTGGEVEISTGADLVFNMSESGTMSLIGRAEVESGSYYEPQFKKKFLLEKGSYLSWSGDPYNPMMKIVANYLVKTSPFNLMAEDIAGLSKDEKKAYNKKLPFTVSLNLEGELAKSQMTFTITLPKSEQGAMNGTVNNKLLKIASDEAEVNKQAISMLLIGGFIPSGSSDGNKGFGGTEFALQTASQQMNNLADYIIKKKNWDFDLNFDLQSYDDLGTSGDAQLRTDLKVQASKKFWDDRLEFLFGGVFLLQGSDQEQSTNKIAPTLMLAYKITKDGRYSLRILQQNQYKGLLEGQVLERGVSVMFTKDYDKFRDLFRKPEEVKVSEE